MPRHVVVSPEEDLAAFYGGADPVATSGAAPGMQAAPAPVATAMTAAPPPPPPMTAAPPTPRAALPTAPPRAPSPAAKAPDPVLAAVASFFLPGVGQLLAGQGAKGFLFLALALFFCGFGGLLNILAAIDAYLIAQRKQRGETVGEWQLF